MTRPYHLEHLPWTHGARPCGTVHRRAGVLEVMVIMFVSMGNV